jgi:beta-aspartyl-peptidase (threonine type)
MASSTSIAQPTTGKYAIAIHGGAGIEPAKLSAEEKAAFEKALSDCLAVGEKILANGGTALDAVEQTIHALEDEPLFNAGRGAVFNSAGKHELDASIMDGSVRACGAVASVTTVRHPISLARLVMTDTKQVLLIADGAEKLADRYPKLERVNNDWFSTPARRKEWEEKQAKEKAKSEASDSGPASKGTVGCVALDKAGHLAAGTSTGGMTNKPLGRVGDSPIIGAGTYAEDGVCAVSCTGTGEEFIRASAAFHLAALIRYKKLPVAKAAEELLTNILPADVGGIISLDAAGNVALRHNTSGMSRASVDAAGKRVVALGAN